jgi:CO dehydrogenase/acetyl-CoA synthase beta subunit
MMDTRVEKILEIWHKHYENETNHYSEFEHSDIEYFVGCMLYNSFAFSKAHHNLKTIDLSYDFLTTCGEKEYEEAVQTIANISFEKEEDALEFLQEYLQEAKAKYTKSELYLLERLEYHVNAMAQRYKHGVEVQHIDFQNPLLRK